jgi:hypothetical protein
LHLWRANTIKIGVFEFVNNNTFQEFILNLTDLLNRAYSSPTVNVTSEILAAAAAERATDAQRAAVQATKGLLANFEQAMTQSVNHLRELRRAEKKQAKHVEILDRALRYFGESGNPLPVYKAQGMSRMAMEFCQAVGIPVPSADDPAWNVPEDFQAQAPEVTD